MSRKKLRADVAALNGIYRKMSNIRLDDEELTFQLNNRRFTCHLADFPAAVMVWKDGAAEPEFLEGGTLAALLDRIHERNGHADDGGGATNATNATSATSATSATNKTSISLPSSSAVRASAASSSSLQPSLGSSSTQSFVNDEEDELLDASNELEPVAQARRDYKEVVFPFFFFV